jgi:hypothetical protein
VAIDDMTAELARLSDGQQFVGKLLEQRALEGSRGTV